MNADRLDLFGGLHHLRDNLGQPVQPVLLELHADQRLTARILRVDHRAFALRLRQKTQSLRFGLGADRLGFGANPAQQDIGVGVSLGLLHRALFVHALEGNLVRSVRDRAVALGLDVFLGEHDLGARQFRLCPRLRLFNVLGRELNGAVDLLHLDAELGVELQPAQFALLGDFHRLGLPLALNTRILRGDHRPLARLGGFRVARRPDFLDFQVLIDLRLFLLLGEQEPLLGGLELGLSHRDLGIRLDLGALLAVDGDDLGKLAQSDGIEGVVFVERRKRRLVETRQ